MARANIVVQSDVLTKSSPSADIDLLHKFRERMAAWLSNFGHVAVSTGLRDTSFASIHDLSTFSIAFPPGDFALKWVEVMFAVQAIENIGRQIWSELAPEAPSTVRIVSADVDGVPVDVEVQEKGVAAGRRAEVSDVISAPMRPVFALFVMLALIALGWFARPNADEQPVLPPSRSIIVQVYAPATQVAPRATTRSSERPRRRSSRIYTSYGRRSASD